MKAHADLIICPNSAPIVNFILAIKDTVYQKNEVCIYKPETILIVKMYF